MSSVFSPGCTVNVFLVPFCLLYVYQPEKVQGSSLNPSSCCLRQSQTVDLTLNRVSEHMQRREKEHDRWTYESTAGFWKIVMEETTRGYPKIHTPSMVSVKPNQRLWFQRGQESMCSKCFYAYACLHMCMHYSVSACVCMCWSKMVRSKSGGASFPPALISHLGIQAPSTVRSHLFLTGLLS